MSPERLRVAGSGSKIERMKPKIIITLILFAVLVDGYLYFFVEGLRSSIGLQTPSDFFWLTILTSAVFLIPYSIYSLFRLLIKG